MGHEFDQFAKDYREIHTQNVEKLSGADSDYFSKYKIEEIKTLLVGKRVLDLGCGDGTSAKYIDEICEVESYTGIDVSEQSIAEATKQSIDGFTFLAYDGETIPFEDNSFDVVFIACVLHHIDPAQRVNILRECRRVLSDDGKIIIFEHNPRNPLTLKTVKDCPFDEGVVLVRNRKLKQMLIKAGFENNIKTNYTIFMPRKGFFVKLIPIEKHLKWCGIGGQYYCVALKKMTRKTSI